MTTPTKLPTQAIYLELVRQFPLRPIRTDEELDRAIAVMDVLVDRESLNQDERDYLDVLSDLVERYETEVHPIAPVSDAVLLTHLLEAKGVTQADVSANTGIAESTISEFLSGKRKPNRIHIGKLAAYFHVGPGVFYKGEDMTPGGGIMSRAAIFERLEACGFQEATTGSGAAADGNKAAVGYKHHLHLSRTRYGSLYVSRDCIAANGSYRDAFVDAVPPTDRNTGHGNPRWIGADLERLLCHIEANYAP